VDETDITTVSTDKDCSMNFNIPEMLAKVQEMQAKMADAQTRLRQLETTAEVGGGMVRVRANGKQEVLSISIEKSVVSPDDVSMLEDLIVSAVNKALDQSRALAQDELGKATSGMIPDIPGLDLGSMGLK
jgi:DNA-binding YbaB/EbfC family protein